MKRIPGVRRLVRLFDARRPLASEVDDELRFHIECRVDDLVARGVSDGDARRTALAEFGDVRRYRDDTIHIDRQWAREARMNDYLESVASDLGYGWRTLRRSPAFTATAIVTLGLCIGATTAVFSAVSGVLLRPLPFNDADRIVHIGERRESRPGRGGTTSYENFDDWRHLSRSFESMGLYSTYAPTLTGHGDAERLPAAIVTAGFFDVFRIKPYLGRALEARDNDLTAEAVGLLSYDFWRARFGGDPAVIGTTVQLNFAPVRVVGILPPGFRPPESLDRPLWLNFVNNTNDGRGGRSKNVYARLAPGVSIAQASAEMQSIAARLATMYPKDNKAETTAVDAVSDLVYGDVRRPLYLLLGASGLVLLIGCANLSNLLLARGMARGREIAVRTALGAGRRRIARQLLTESLLLSLIGSAAGVAVAWLAVRTLSALGPELFRARPPEVDGRVVAFAIGASLLTAVLFGLVPTLRLAQSDTSRALREAGMRTTGSRSGRTRAFLALAQLSLAVILLSASGLVLKSFARVLHTEPGIVSTNLLTAGLTLPRSRYDSLRSTLFYERLRAEVTAAPGVRGVAVTSLLPFSGDFDRVSVSKISGRPETNGAEAPVGDRYVVSPSYFAAMGIKLLRGRLLSDDDGYDGEVVCVIDEVFAHNTFGMGDPIGATMKLPQRSESARIVGVVTHVKTYGLDVRSPGQIYMSNQQYPWRWMSVVVRTNGDPMSFLPTLTRIVHRLDPDQPVADATSMEQYMSDLLRNRRFTLVLLASFSGVAITLAAIGLYGVVAFGVSRRRRELGVRLALGAQRRQIAAMILSEGTRIAVAGALLGSLGALATGSLLSSLLFEVSPRDPLILGGVTTLLMVIAIIASVVPARRATRVSACEVLRGD